MQRVLVIGLGIGGCLLTEALRNLGILAFAADDRNPTAASRVAPGIVNPLAGKKLKPSWNVATQLPLAHQTYRQLESILGSRLLHPTPILRIIRDRKQARCYEQRLEESGAAALIGVRHPPNTFAPRFADPFGSFEAVGSAWVDVLRLTNLYAERLASENRLIPERVEPSAVSPTSRGASVCGEDWDLVIFAEGWRAMANPWFADLPFNPARGEMLDLEVISGTPDHARIINCGKWLLPLGDGRYRAGATYAWSDFEALPTEGARNEILDMLKVSMSLEFRVTGQRAGVRPILRDYHPVAGRHPRHSGIAILNGFGSKGVLTGPSVCEAFAKNLVGGFPLPSEIALTRFAARSSA